MLAARLGGCCTLRNSGRYKYTINNNIMSLTIDDRTGSCYCWFDFGYNEIAVTFKPEWQR